MTGANALGLTPGALAAVSFLAIAVLLAVYSVRHGVRRRKALVEWMPARGFQRIDEPLPKRLVPDPLSDPLFYPNGFASEHRPDDFWTSYWIAQVPLAWEGSLGSVAVTVMEVSIARSKGSRRTTEATRKLGHTALNRTVIRHDPVATVRPPDFALEERVLFKGQIRGHLAVNGPHRIGEHYYVFSDSTESALEPWITQALREQLTQHRLWKIAAHAGVLYLTRNTTHQALDQIDSFLREGDSLLRALLSSQRHRRRSTRHG